MFVTYELEEDTMGEYVQVKNSEIEFDGKRNQENSPHIPATIRILRVKLQSCREENERMIKALEEKNQLTTTML